MSYLTHILKNTGPTTLTQKWYEDGVQSDAGTVTIGIVDAAGATVVAAGTATSKSGSGATTAYSYDLAKQTTVKRLTVTWTRTDTGAALVETVEVVGRHLFTIAQARAWDNACMANTTLYPAATVAEERARITGAIGEAIGWPPIPMYGRLTFNGTGDDTLRLPSRHVTSIISVTVDGTAYTVAELADLIIDDSLLIRDTAGTFTAGNRNVIVEYQWGPSIPIPDADRIGLYLLRERLVPANVSARALSMSNEIGTVQYALPSARFPFGVPVVDQWVKAHDERRSVA